MRWNARSSEPPVDLEDAVADLLDALRDAEAVHGLHAPALENEHVERAQLTGLATERNG
jgi:hypothetical protein